MRTMKENDNIVIKWDEKKKLTVIEPKEKAAPKRTAKKADEK